MTKSKDNKAQTKPQKADEPSDTELEKKFNRFLEEVKVTNDYLKHIATLNIALIVFISAFLEKPTSPESGGTLLGSLIFIIASLVLLLGSQRLLVNHVAESVDDITKVPTKTWKTPYRLFTLLAYLCFIFSLSFLAVYIAYNIFKILG